MCYTVAVGLCALYFWGWAVLNCLREDQQGHHSFDAGVVSFLFPLASAAVLFIWRPEESQKMSVLRGQRWAMGLTPIVPAANYAFGIHVVASAGPPTLIVYFAAGVAWWALAALVGVVLLTRVVWLRGAKGENAALSQAMVE